MSSSCQNCWVLPSQNLNYSLCSPLLCFHSYQSSPTTPDPGPSICPAVPFSSPSVTRCLPFLPIQGPQFGNLSICHSPIPCPGPPGRCHLTLNLLKLLEFSQSHPSAQPAEPMSLSHHMVPELAVLCPHHHPTVMFPIRPHWTIITPPCPSVLSPDRRCWTSPHRVSDWPCCAHVVTPLC